MLNIIIHICNKMAFFSRAKIKLTRVFNFYKLFKRKKKKNGIVSKMLGSKSANIRVKILTVLPHLSSRTFFIFSFSYN